MRAIRLHQFGPAENLVLDEVADPEPGADQVRIAVGAAGVHVLDTFIRAGTTGGPFPLPDLPTVPGREVAGVVDEVGPGVDAAWVGRRVVAHLGMASGGYAELALASVSALHEIPSGMDDEVAVTMIGTGRTAFGILEAAAITTDDVVLVTAAAGGLGSLLRPVGAARTEPRWSAWPVDPTRWTSPAGSAPTSRSTTRGRGGPTTSAAPSTVGR